MPDRRTPRRRMQRRPTQTPAPPDSRKYAAPYPRLRGGTARTESSRRECSWTGAREPAPEPPLAGSDRRARRCRGGSRDRRPASATARSTAAERRPMPGRMQRALVPKPEAWPPTRKDRDSGPQRLACVSWRTSTQRNAGARPQTGEPQNSRLHPLDPQLTPALEEAMITSASPATFKCSAFTVMLAPDPKAFLYTALLCSLMMSEPISKGTV